MTSETKQKQELQDLVELLQNIRGRHTELVSVLIPAGANINLVQRQLESEKSTAANIKSKQTRNNVITALETIIRKMKEIKQTPKNGLAIYSGNVSEKPGVDDIQLWTIEPFKPLNTRLYRCDQTFVIEPLKEMLEVDEVYGILAIDRKEATIALLEGKQVKTLRKLTSGVPGKVRAGGQCLSPDTLVETEQGVKQIKDITIGKKIKALDTSSNIVTFTKVIDKWKVAKDNYMQFITNNNKIITSSEEHTFFLNDNNRLLEISANMILTNHILINNKKQNEIITKIIKKNQKIELIDIETEAGNFFANNLLVHNSSQRFHRITEGLAKEFFRRVAEEMKELFFNLPKLKGILIGGPIPTKDEFLDEGQLVTKLKELVIAIKDVGYADEHGIDLIVEASQDELSQQELIKEKKILERFFETLGKHPEKAAYGLERTKLALERGAVQTLLVSNKLDKKTQSILETSAENIGSEIIIISTETPEGDQFLNLTKGAGALLRFALE